MSDLDRYVDLHWCVNRQGKGVVRRYSKSLCSNCVPRDPRCYELSVPESEVEYAEKRMYERDE